MSRSDMSEPSYDMVFSGPAQRLGFLLINDFSMMSYASVIEPFRAANRLSGRGLYGWRHFSVDGAPARASNGVEINVDGPLGGTDDLDLLFVCAGGNPAAFRNPGAFARLRSLAARGTVIVGVSGGAFPMARAGLLEGFRCTIHWEHERAFVETFPGVAVEGGLFVIDRSRVTCAGGTAGLDLAIALITDVHGTDLGGLVSDWYIRTQTRPAASDQRTSITQRYGVSHAGLVAALAAMEDHKEDPLDRQALARTAGVSVRQLERLFRSRVRTTVRDHYLRIRLEEAMRLLRETDLSRVDIALACGFRSASHFSRRFRGRFGVNPSTVPTRRSRAGA
jgi:transcriptional regulator GlxA family with amidase domain